MIDSKKIKWYKRIGLFFACFVVFAIPFLTLASDFISDSSEVTYADTNTDYFTGSGLDFLTYTNESYRNTFARVFGLTTTVNNGTATIDYYLKLCTRLEYNSMYYYYSNNTDTTSETYQRETIYGFNQTFTRQGGFTFNQLLGSYHSYARLFNVSNNSQDWVPVSWGNVNTTSLYWQVTYSTGNVGASNFGTVSGIKFGALLGIETNTANQLDLLLRTDNVYVEQSALHGGSSLFIIQLFDENNCCLNFIFETNLQYSNDYWKVIWQLFNNPVYPQMRTYYLANTESSQYQQGYRDGQNEGENTGYNEGYSNGYNRGYADGEDAGFRDGVLHANDYSFLGLLGAVIDAPIQAFNGLLDFDLLGFNMRDFYLGLFSVCIIVLVVRLVMFK